MNWASHRPPSPEFNVLEFHPDGNVTNPAVLFAAAFPKGRHVALVYRSATDDSVYICHLEGHERLTNEVFQGTCFLGKAAMDDANQAIVAAWLQLLPPLTTDVPYGLDPTGCQFDLETGAYIPGVFGKGLTCATFVFAVFETLGISLADYSTWPTRDDDADWQEWIVGILETNDADPALVKAIREDIGMAKRIRPVEAAASVMKSVGAPPLSFGDIQAMSEELLAEVSR